MPMQIAYPLLRVGCWGSIFKGIVEIIRKLNTRVCKIKTTGKIINRTVQWVQAPLFVQLRSTSGLIQAQSE
jgi:hypothetical protein